MESRSDPRAWAPKHCAPGVPDFKAVSLPKLLCLTLAKDLCQAQDKIQILLAAPWENWPLPAYIAYICEQTPFKFLASVVMDYLRFPEKRLCFHLSVPLPQIVPWFITPALPLNDVWHPLSITSPQPTVFTCPRPHRVHFCEATDNVPEKAQAWEPGRSAPCSNFAHSDCVALERYGTFLPGENA